MPGVEKVPGNRPPDRWQICFAFADWDEAEGKSLGSCGVRVDVCLHGIVGLESW